MSRRFISKFFAVDLPAAPLWQRILFYTSLVVFVTSLGVSLNDLSYYDGGDFNLRYIQARCGFFDLNPYTTTADWWWNGIAQNVHERYFKGVPRPWGVACQTPALLLFYMPVSTLDRETARWVSGLFEWLAFLTSIVLLARVIEQKSDRLLAVAITLFFFSGSPFWRLHVERGQYYIFTVLFISTLLFVLTRKKNDFLSGVVLGITVSIRPTVLFLALPFAMQRRWKILSGALCSGLFMGFLSLYVFGADAWKSFNWISTKYELASIDFSKNPFEDCMKTPQVPPCQAYERSEKVAGAPFSSINCTMAGLLRVTRPILDRHAVPINTLLLAMKLLGAGLSLAFVILLSRKCKGTATSSSPPPDMYLAYVGLASINLVEYVIPYRAAYADIYYLLLVMLGIPIVARQKSTWLGVLLLIALASQQNLLGLVHGWYAIPVRVVGLTLFSFGVLYFWHNQRLILHTATGTDKRM